MTGSETDRVMEEIDRTLNAEYYDDVSRRWIDVENEDYSVRFAACGGIMKFRFFVDDGTSPSNLYTAETNAQWITL